MSKDHILLFSVATSTLLVGAILSSTNVAADSDVVSTATISVPQSCTMSGTGMNSHNAEIQSGTYTANIGTTTLHAYCNDSAGFAVYAIGYTDNEFGKNVLTDSTLGNTYDIVTGTNTSGSTSNWAMKLAITQDSGDTTGTNAFTIDNSFGSYHNVPAEYTKVAHKNTATDMADTTGGAKLTTTYAVLISSTQPAGTYIGQVKYTLVHPATKHPLEQTATSGCINYFANAGNAVGTMGCQSISASDTSATLYASNFSREGYGFAGWSDAYDYKTNPNAHFYGPNEDITFTAGQYTGTNNGLSLYAVWVKSAGSFQNSSEVTTACNSLTQASTSGTRTLASVSALTDTRDNQTYAIAKLADGKCWMIENLRLDNTAELTTLNTNNPLNDGNDVTLKHNYIDTDAYNTLSATSSVAYNADTAPDGWCTISSAACNNQSRLRTDNTANRATYAQNDNMSTGANLYSYGNYYNWYSATAGRGTYSFNTKNNSTAGDLCPAGWRLPKGGYKANVGVSDFWILSRAAIGADPANFANDYFYYAGTPEGTDASKVMRSYPNNYLYSGHVSGGSLLYRGSDSLYWSSTAGGNHNTYSLFLGSSYVYPGTNNNGKYYGRTLRCIANP